MNQISQLEVPVFIVLLVDWNCIVSREYIENGTHDLANSLGILISTQKI